MSFSNNTSVGIFLPSLRGGGAERVMMTLAKGLAERGLNVDLVLAKAEGAYLSRVSSRFRVVDLASIRVLTSLPGLVGYLRRERPAYFLSAMGHANVVALWARRLARVPTQIVVGEHSTLSCSAENSCGVKGRWMPCFVRCFYPWADGIVAVSHGVAEDLSRISSLPRNSIRVIYNPVVTSELLDKTKEPIEHPWFAKGQPPVVLGVGRLTKAKDFSLLIRAFSQVRRKRLSKLLILGEGEERPRLQALVTELGLEEDVALAGFVGNPFSYMAKAALFVLSSRWEGLPTALIEAMACGTSVVSTNCPSGPEEILENGKYGLLVQRGDIEALAEAILSTLDARPNSKALQHRASEFSLNNACDQYLEFLYSLR
jgi:glycosyltransferase involved in cell wall biosynthesis